MTTAPTTSPSLRDRRRRTADDDVFAGVGAARDEFGDARFALERPRERQVARIDRLPGAERAHREAAHPFVDVQPQVLDRPCAQHPQAGQVGVSNPVRQADVHAVGDGLKHRIELLRPIDRRRGRPAQGVGDPGDARADQGEEDDRCNALDLELSELDARGEEHEDFGERRDASGDQPGTKAAIACREQHRRIELEIWNLVLQRRRQDEAHSQEDQRQQHAERVAARVVHVSRPAIRRDPNARPAERRSGRWGDRSGGRLPAVATSTGAAMRRPPESPPRRPAG